MIGLESPYLQAARAREIHPLQVLDGQLDLHWAGGIDPLGPIRLAVFNGQGAGGDTRGELRQQVILSFDGQGRDIALLDGKLDRVIDLHGGEVRQAAFFGYDHT